MRFNLVLAALLCFTTWMSVVHAQTGPVTACCEQWSTTRIPVKQIKNYTIQCEGICPITAVIFQTCKGKKLCSEPNTDWARKAIQKVDRETQALLEGGQNECTPATNITPAASTTSKKAPNRRRRQKKQFRKGNKGPRKCVF